MEKQSHKHSRLVLHTSDAWRRFVLTPHATGTCTCLIRPPCCVSPEEATCHVLRLRLCEVVCVGEVEGTCLTVYFSPTLDILHAVRAIYGHSKNKVAASFNHNTWDQRIPSHCIDIHLYAVCSSVELKGIVLTRAQPVSTRYPSPCNTKKQPRKR